MIRETLSDLGYDDAVLFDNPDFDNAVVGITTDGRVVYDYALMVKDLFERGGCSFEEAMDFIDYNSIRSAAYQPNGPIVFYRVVPQCE